MSKISLEPNASGAGTFTLAAPNSNTNRTLNLPDEAGKLLSTGNDDPAEVFKQSNILGTVSESGGVPTGGIIERGSNANGEFVKYADGTLFAYRRVDLTDGEFPTSLGDEVGISTTYSTAANFASRPTVHLTAIAFTSGFGGSARKAMSAWIRDQAGTVLSRGDRFTTHGVLLRLEERQFNSPNTCSLFFSAIGRWF